MQDFCIGEGNFFRKANSLLEGSGDMPPSPQPPSPKFVHNNYLRLHEFGVFGQLTCTVYVTTPSSCSNHNMLTTVILLWLLDVKMNFAHLTAMCKANFILYAYYDL